MSLWDDLTVPANRGRSTFHCWGGQRYESTPWSAVIRDAGAMTAGLRRAGVRPGSRVATILTNTPHAVRGILGTWLAGGALASLPLPARGMAGDEYLAQLKILFDHVRPAATLVDEAMLALLPDDFRARVNARSWESVAGSGTVAASPPAEDDVVFIQYSSGSTSTPKGSALTARAIQAQLKIIVEMMGLRPGVDRALSWLPLSHDMGIFGCLLTPWATGMDLFLSTPERFMMAPGTWFTDAAATGATVSCGTNTALALVTRRLRARGLDRPLQLRTLILGAERLEWEVIERALEVFGPYGLTPETLMPAYGLAEAALAVTHTPPHEAPRSITVDGVALADGLVTEVAANAPAATRIVSSGVPCAGVELGALADGELAEIRVRSPSLATGYFADEARTAERFVDGELFTRDLGFVRDGYLYPVGRVDDLISIGGRKVYAREIEAAVDALDGVRRGCSTLVETHDGVTQRLTLIMEVGQGVADVRRLAEQAAALAMGKAAVSLDRCLFLSAGTVPKTPSGKIQRYRCREMLVADRFQPVDLVDFARV